MKKERFVTYVFIIIILSVAFSSLYYLKTNMTGFAVLTQGNQSEFDEGTYNNTEYNGSTIILSGDDLTGTYESKIFDAGNDAIWNNLTWQGSEPSLTSLFCVDGSGAVYKSTDSGITWSLSQENFGRTTATADMFSNSNYLYILSSVGNEVWNSSDGTDFKVVYSGFEGKSPYVGVSDSENLYVAVGSGEVWKSTDNGLSWVKQGDINGAATNNPKGMAIDSKDYIYAVDGTGKVFKSTDSGVSWTKVNDNYGGSTGTDGMKSDSLDNLYILMNTKIYKSSDSGVSWSILNDSISPYANTLVKILITNEDNFFILDAAGRVFKSNDYGISWQEIGDCNNAATNDPKGITEFIQNTHLTFQVRNCSLPDCSDANFFSADLSNLNLQGRYFQYKVLFKSPDSSITPTLTNLEVNYNLINSPPTITLVEPQNLLYTYNNSLPLNISVSDIDGNLDSCWYNIDSGENITIPNCQNTTFDVAEGSHIINIYANDTNGLESSDSVSFNVDVTGISLSIVEPSGTKTSRTNIPLEFTAIGNNLTCWYNVKTSIGGSIIENTTLENCSDSSFNVSTDGDYILNLYANNSLGNLDYTSSEFSVSTTSSDRTTPPSSGGGGGGGSGGGGGILTGNITSRYYRLHFTKIPDLIVNPGEIKKMVLPVKSIGTKFLNDCKLQGTGKHSEWISSPGEIKDLSPGELHDFIFTLKVPETAEPKPYTLNIAISCQETIQSTNLTVEIIEKKFSLELINVESFKNNIKINYSLTELTGKKQEIEVEIILFGYDNERTAEKSTTRTLKANSKQAFQETLKIPDNIKGDLNLLINANSEVYSTFVQEEIILGTSYIGGLAIFLNKTKTDTFLSSFLIIVFVLFVFFMIRRILKFRKIYK